MSMPSGARRLVTITGATLVAAAVLTACSTGDRTGRPTGRSERGAGTSAAASTSQHVTVRVTDRLRFRPSTVTVHVGTVRVTLLDDGSYPHNLSVPGVHTTSPTVTGSPGERSTTVTLRFGRPGSYPFECAYHASAGMRGRFVVEP
jgi:plastocyanin